MPEQPSTRRDLIDDLELAGVADREYLETLTFHELVEWGGQEIHDQLNRGSCGVKLCPAATACCWPQTRLPR